VGIEEGDHARRLKVDGGGKERKRRGKYQLGPVAGVGGASSGKKERRRERKRGPKKKKKRGGLGRRQEG